MSIRSNKSTGRTSPARPFTLARGLTSSVERELWARAAGRCQFSDCNRPLYKSPVTQERVNIAEEAHIYSFSPDGPRGHEGLEMTAINSIDNLILACHDCHKTIDQDKLGERYSAQLLQQWKRDHESRIFVATAIPPKKRSHVVFYTARIGKERSVLNIADAYEAMFPNWFPASEQPINISMQSEADDGMEDYWEAEVRNLRRTFDRHIRPLLEDGSAKHLSILALAPQPLLILLGSLITDKVNAAVYQLHREPRTWAWQPHPDNFEFALIPPARTQGTPALVLSLSGQINLDHVQASLGAEPSIWHIKIKEPFRDFLRSEAQLMMFRDLVRRAYESIRAAYPDAPAVHVFPAAPVSCAVELGRVRLPKADLPLIVYDWQQSKSKFIEAIRIGD